MIALKKEKKLLHSCYKSKFCKKAPLYKSVKVYTSASAYLVAV